MAEDEGDQMMVRATGALLAAVDPTAGVATALVAHHLTNISNDATIRAAAQELWVDILSEEQESRREQFRAVDDEFQRQRYILDWLREELADLTERVETLEAVALAQIQEAESLVRLRPEPEMRPYIRAALRNALIHRDRFSPTWVRRLTTLLGQIGAEHIEALDKLQEHAQGPQGILLDERFSGLVAGEERIVLDELLEMELIRRFGKRNLTPTTDLLPLGRKLIDFVSSG